MHRKCTGVVSICRIAVQGVYHILAQFHALLQGKIIIPSMYQLGFRIVLEELGETKIQGTSAKFNAICSLCFLLLLEQFLLTKLEIIFRIDTSNLLFGGRA